MWKKSTHLWKKSCIYKLDILFFTKDKFDFLEFFSLTPIRTGKCLRGHEITTLYNLPVKIIFSFSFTELSG